MIEHTLYYMGRFLFVQKFQHVYELGPTENFAQPGQILGQLQCITMYLYTTKTAAIIRPFYMISSSKQVFYSIWTRLLHIQKYVFFYFDQVIAQNQSWTICYSNLAKQINRTQTCCHDVFWKLPWWLLLSMHISTTSMLQSTCLRSILLHDFVWTVSYIQRIRSKNPSCDRIVNKTGVIHGVQQLWPLPWPVVWQRMNQAP